MSIDTTLKPVSLADIGKKQVIDPESGKTIKLTPTERRNFRLISPGVKADVSPTEYAQLRDRLRNVDRLGSNEVDAESRSDPYRRAVLENLADTGGDLLDFSLGFIERGAGLVRTVADLGSLLPTPFSDDLKQFSRNIDAKTNPIFDTGLTSSGRLGRQFGTGYKLTGELANVAGIGKKFGTGLLKRGVGGRRAKELARAKTPLARQTAEEGLGAGGRFGRFAVTEGAIESTFLGYELRKLSDQERYEEGFDLRTELALSVGFTAGLGLIGKGLKRLFRGAPAPAQAFQGSRLPPTSQESPLALPKAPTSQDQVVGADGQLKAAPNSVYGDEFNQAVDAVNPKLTKEVYDDFAKYLNKQDKSLAAQFKEFVKSGGDDSNAGVWHGLFAEFLKNSEKYAELRGSYLDWADKATIYGWANDAPVEIREAFAQDLAKLEGAGKADDLLEVKKLQAKHASNLSQDSKVELNREVGELEAKAADSPDKDEIAPDSTPQEAVEAPSTAKAEPKPTAKPKPKTKPTKPKPEAKKSTTAKPKETQQVEIKPFKTKPARTKQFGRLFDSVIEGGEVNVTAEAGTARLFAEGDKVRLELSTGAEPKLLDRDEFVREFESTVNATPTQNRPTEITLSGQNVADKAKLAKKTTAKSVIDAKSTNYNKQATGKTNQKILNDEKVLEESIERQLVDTDLGAPRREADQAVADFEATRNQKADDYVDSVLREAGSLNGARRAELANDVSYQNQIYGRADDYDPDNPGFCDYN